MAKPDLKIGILGGSFNPAHDGHRYISLQALERLDLDVVWWLISPQNPLKSSEGMADFEERFVQAKSIANHPDIEVKDIEHHLDSNYSYDTMQHLISHYPTHQFVWLMGADNMVQVPKWYKWQDFFRLMPIAIFDRDEDKDAALNGEAAQLFKSYYVKDSKQLANHPAPAWTFLAIEKHPASATDIRNQHNS